MRALLKEAQSSLQHVTQMRHAYNSIVNERSMAFEKLDVQAQRIVGTLLSLQVPKPTIQDARYYTRLIAGRRATPRLPVLSEDSEEQPLKVRGYAQLSYVAKASNFAKLVQMVEAMPLYVTNEPDLMIGELKEKAAYLQQKNEEVHKAQVALKNAMMQRDRLLYKGSGAVVNNASAIKHYARVVFGARSKEADLLTDVSFTKPRVK
ncbi:MAG: hypothetical protein ABJH04_10075 [Cyclobacteriaceae bacterium]